MTFECKRCGKIFEVEGFKSDGTFYTLCPLCTDIVLMEERTGVTAAEIKTIRQKKKKRNIRAEVKREMDSEPWKEHQVSGNPCDS